MSEVRTPDTHTITFTGVGLLPRFASVETACGSNNGRTRPFASWDETVRIGGARANLQSGDPASGGHHRFVRVRAARSPSPPSFITPAPHPYLS